MYLAQTTKSRIKSMCKEKGVNMETLLTECGLGVNAIRQINDTKGMASFSLARLADYLDCSVDYLLGRTTNPSSHKQTIIIGEKTMSFAERLREVMRIRDIGASDLATKMYGIKDNDHFEHAKRISYIVDAHASAIEPTQEEIEKLADALYIAVDQLTGTEKITMKCLRPYNPGLEGEAFRFYAATRSLEFHPNGTVRKPLGTTEDGKTRSFTAAGSTDHVAPEYVDLDNERMKKMKNTPESEDIM